MKRSACLVEITTDNGLTGWGEAFAQGLDALEISAVVIEHALRPLLLGADPLDVEVLWHRMYHGPRNFGRRGSVIACLPVCNCFLFARKPVLEYVRSSHPFWRELTTQPIELTDGVVIIPTGPGLGIEVIPETLDRYRVN